MSPPNERHAKLQAAYLNLKQGHEEFVSDCVDALGRDGGIDPEGSIVPWIKQLRDENERLRSQLHVDCPRCGDSMAMTCTACGEVAPI